MLGAHWPLFLYENHEYDPVDPWKGLFRGTFLLKVRMVNKVSIAHFYPLVYRLISTSSPRQALSIIKSPRQLAAGTRVYMECLRPLWPRSLTSPLRYAAVFFRSYVELNNYFQGSILPLITQRLLPQQLYHRNRAVLQHLHGFIPRQTGAC